MKGAATKKKPLSRAERAELDALARLSDDQMDTVDVPEAPEANWIYAQRGTFYRPIKQSVTIRLDADVLAWFRRHTAGRGYQTEINQVLRRPVEESERRGK